MATKKAASKGAGKKAGGSKKAAAKKGSAKKGSAKKGASKKAAAPAVKGKCGNWKAWLNRMPPGPATINVTGECVFPSHGYKVTLKKAIPQGINPFILLLRKTVTPPSRPGAQTPQKVTAEFHSRASINYTHVTILPDGVTVKVKTVV